MKKIIKNFIVLLSIFSIFLLASCGGGGGGGTSTSTTTPGGGGSAGGTTVVATAADNVSKVKISSFVVNDACNITLSATSYDNNNNPVNNAGILLTVTDNGKSHSYSKNTDANGEVTFNVDVCNDLTTSSVKTSVAVPDGIYFKIKPNSTISKAVEQVHIKADNNGKVDLNSLISELNVSIDNFTQDNVTFKIESLNKISGEKIYVKINDEKILLNDPTDNNGVVYYTYTIPSGTSSATISAEPFFKKKDFKANAITIPYKNGKTETSKILTNLSLLSSKLSIFANDNDTVNITVYGYNQYGAANGVPLEVSSDYGKVSLDNITLDNGFANFYFSSPYYSGITEATIKVTDPNTGISKRITIGLKGVILKVNASKTFIKSDGSDNASISISVTDSANNPIQDKTILISTNDANISLKKGDNELTFNNDNLTSVKSDINGLVNLTISSFNAGDVNLTISVDNNSETLSFKFSGEKFEFSEIDNKTISSNEEISVGTVHEIKFKWIKDDGTPQNNASLDVYTNLGLVSNTSGNCFSDNKTYVSVNITNGEGIFYYCSNIPGSVTIGASSDSDNKSTLLNASVVSNNEPVKIIIQAQPSVIPVSTESVKNTSTITALLLDKNNYPLHNKKVIFSILQSTNSGEEIYPVLSSTDISGKAYSYFTAGYSSSAQNGIIVEAQYKDNSSLKDNITLTVIGEAVNLAIGKGSKIYDSGETNYKYPLSVLVTDSNGSPIENQQINLSIHAYQYRTQDKVNHLNEDLNLNNILDPGEDINGNGELDPGNVVSIPSEVITDSSGFATFYIEYSKCYCTWVDVVVRATTLVFGTENYKEYTFTLPCSKDDVDDGTMPCASPFD